MKMTNTQRRAIAYEEGQKQMIEAVETLLAHIKTKQNAPTQTVAYDISKIRQAHMKLRDLADLYGLELMALEL